MSVIDVLSTTLFDPYLNYRFQLRFSGMPLPVLGIKKITALKRTTKATEYQSGGEPGLVHKVPGTTTFDPITLERGVTVSPEFMIWANLPQAMGHEISGLDYYHYPPLNMDKKIRRDVVIEVLSSMRIPTISYQVYGCWVSEYQALADLDGEDGNKILFESIKLEHDGWEFLDPVSAAKTYLPF